MIGHQNNRPQQGFYSTVDSKSLRLLTTLGAGAAAAFFCFFLSGVFFFLGDFFLVTFFFRAFLDGPTVSTSSCLFLLQQFQLVQISMELKY
jgi:hypothetical protein